MSHSAQAAIIIGVSYIDLLEERGTEPIEDKDQEITELGLTSWTNIPVFDRPNDVFVGVVFNKRPTDAEVEEAKKKVEEALPALKELFGEPSSAVETWMGVSVD